MHRRHQGESSLVTFTKATMDGQKLTVEYEFSNGGSPFSINSGFHVHFYGANADGSNPSDSIMGAQASRRGNWYVEDKQPSVHNVGTDQYSAIKGQPKVSRPRSPGAAINSSPDTSGSGTFTTGNCAPITQG